MMKKIKVMHFVSGLGNDGVTQVIKNYTSRLNQSYNIENIIVYQHHADRSKIDELQKIGDKLYEIPYKSKHPFANLYETCKIIKKEKPDIVHAHMSLLSFYPLFVAKLLGIKVRIAHAHIAQDNVNPKLVKIFKRLTLLFANHYLACGELAGKYLFNGKKFDVLYNAIDQDKFKFNLQKRKGLREKLGINKNTIILGTLGRLTEQKNQLFLIDIFNEFNKENPNSKLIIVGVGELESQIKKKIKSLQCSKNIQLISGTKDPASYYCMFDYFLLPSLYEGLPVSAVEAQASGVNTILSDNIDKDVKYNSNVIFVPINNGEKPWLDAIKKLEFNKRVNFNKDNNYNIDLQYHKLYQIYNKLIKLVDCKI
ncbi:glycosyltransferase family 1 protein [Limosilactobacillus fermentum]|nr:glycosyltransferase family 1 protein [Limosilactobacillus fermentum]